MKYKAIVFDIDGTIVEPVSSWRYIHEKLGKWDALACRYQEMFLAGQLSYAEFCELDAGHWRGMKEENMRKIFNGVRFARNSRIVLKELKRMGFLLIALSTGLQYIPERLRSELGFDVIVSNELISNSGIITGRVKIKITHGGKGKVLKKILEKLKISPDETISVGDSEGDIPIAKMTGYSIAFNSSSAKLSESVDYNCKTDDFREVLKCIKDIHIHPV